MNIKSIVASWVFALLLLGLVSLLSQPASKPVPTEKSILSLPEDGSAASQDLTDRFQAKPVAMTLLLAQS